MPAAAKVIIGCCIIIVMKTLLILGLGDIAQRALPALSDWCITAPKRAVFDLDAPDFTQLPLKVDALLYCIPPAKKGTTDVRMKQLLNFWQTNGGAPAHIVYISTSGVYGDCSGEWVDESRTSAPTSPRSILRADCEQQLQLLANELRYSLSILRAPGIYARERLPLQRIRDGVPILSTEDDVYSNHIHADDLANMCVTALNQANGISIYNACDDTPTKVGDWFCALAKTAGLPLPQAYNKEVLKPLLSPLQWSFMSESRRLSNKKIKRELGIVLRYPSVFDFLNSHQPLLT